MDLKNYIENFSLAVYKKDCELLRRLISIGNQRDLKERSSFPTPSPYDLLSVGDERWGETLKSYLFLTKALFIRQDIKESFNLMCAVLSNLNRCAERETNWVLPALVATTKDLRKLFLVLQEYCSNKDNGFGYFDTANVSGDYAYDKVIQMADIINKSFKVCLNDKTAETQLSKKCATFFFVGELFKLYVKLNKFDLVCTLEKVLRAGRDLPGLHSIERAHSVTYLYYSGLVACSSNDLETAQKRLLESFSLCLKSAQSQQVSILILLLPLQLLTQGQMPNNRLWGKFPSVDFLYRKIFKAVKRGDLKTFDHELKKLEKILLKRKLYLVFLKMRSLVIARLFSKVYRIEKTHILSIHSLQVALQVSLTHAPFAGSFIHSTESVECILANLICDNLIKGYISHGNQVVVLSKKDAFPRVGDRN